MLQKSIDLNADLGEGLITDALMMPFISSANIACGAHAGDEHTMRHTIALCLEHGVAIGAHPSFADRNNFGRIEMELPYINACHDLIMPQLETIASIAAKMGGRLIHVKPHGALYNMSAGDWRIANMVAESVKAFDPSLLLFGLSGSHSVGAASSQGLQTVAEVFADRTYQGNGKLTPRKMPGALIENDEMALAQVRQMVFEGSVTATSGVVIPLCAESVCLHGDGAHAVAFATRISGMLKEYHVAIRPKHAVY